MDNFKVIVDELDVEFPLLPNLLVAGFQILQPPSEISADHNRCLRLLTAGSRLLSYVPIPTPVLSSAARAPASDASVGAASKSRRVILIRQLMVCCILETSKEQDPGIPGEEGSS
jgi:hypothetical protein